MSPSSPAAPEAAPREPVPAENPAGDQTTDALSRDTSPDSEKENGEVSEPDDASEEASARGEASEEAAPPLPNESVPDGPPLPQEPLPDQSQLQPVDDGWDCQYDPSTQAWFFYNRLTGKSQWDNPRVPTNTPAVAAAPGTQPSVPQPPVSEKPAAGGYNPAIHGDYDPNAWYAQGTNENENAALLGGAVAAVDPYTATATFNRFTGQFQTDEDGPDRHTDEAKSRRQMNAFFDVDAAANSHDGRSLKAERSGKKPSKNELKAFKEKRRARKEEKRRAWLRD